MYRWMLLIAVMVLAACQASDDAFTNPKVDPANNQSGGLFGGDGINILGGGAKKSSAADAGGGGIGVNSFLWRASLDTLSFMPLASADPFGGVIITDWYSPAETPDERLKVNVFILDRQLRADGLRASVFRQKREIDGRWVDHAVASETGAELENTILQRARELRVATASK